jgi:hypothetical protein
VIRAGFLGRLVRSSFIFIVSLLILTPAYAEKIPALLEIPKELPLNICAHFTQQKQALEKKLAEFQAAAAVFNAKDAKEQSDAEYEKLDAWRTRYINAAKAFNQEVAEAGTISTKLGKIATTIGVLGSMRGEFSIESRDGAKLTNSSIQAGGTARIDIGTRVTTGSMGHLQILLLDETVFSIGPNSDIVIDEFVFDPDNGARKVSVRVLKGIFRWVTAKVARKDPSNIKVTLPVGIIGIRGTDFETEVAPDGSGYIKLFSGELEITPKKDGRAFILKAKQMIKFNAAGIFGKPEPIHDLSS